MRQGNEVLAVKKEVRLTFLYKEILLTFVLTARRFSLKIERRSWTSEVFFFFFSVNFGRLFKK